MEQLLPWQRLEKKIKRHYACPGNGRRPYPLSVMLRIHCMQLFYNLSDPAMEDALYEIESMRCFAGLSITDNLLVESTILKFRHLLEKHQLGEKLFQAINAHLDDSSLLLKEGTIVDASIISAPTSSESVNKSCLRQIRTNSRQTRLIALVLSLRKSAMVSGKPGVRRQCSKS